MSSDTFFISKFGWKTIGCLFVLYIMLLVLDLDLLALLAFVGFLGALYLFRNPERIIKHFENSAVIAPCDGVVTFIENDKDKTVISVKNRCQDVSILRAPIDAQTILYEHIKGAALDIHTQEAEKLNEHAQVTFQNTTAEIKVLHKLSLSFLGIRLSMPQRIMRGHRYGLMLHGETQIILPASTRVSVKRGEYIKAGESLIAYI